MNTYKGLLASICNINTAHGDITSRPCEASSDVSVASFTTFDKFDIKNDKSVLQSS